MAKRLFYKRKTAIIYADCFFSAAVLVIYSLYYFKYHWSIALIAFIVLYFAFFFAFFFSRIVRYTLTFLFSAFYGGLFAFIGTLLDRENPLAPALVFGILAFLISIYLHKDHFDFLKGVKVYEYDKY